MMPLYISRDRLRPLNRLASKKSIVIEGKRYNGFVEVLQPLVYRLKRPWMKADDLIEIESKFNGHYLVAGSIDDELHDQLMERYG